MDLERLMTAGSAAGMLAETIMALHHEEQKRLREERAEAREVAKEDEERAKAAEKRPNIAKAAEERAKAADERTYRNLIIEKELTEKKLQLRASNSGEEAGDRSSDVVPRRIATVSPQKLIAPFDERRDDLDAYIQRFERMATGQGWQKSDWATGLSMCLVGEALVVYSRMSATDALEYDKVKKVHTTPQTNCRRLQG